MENNSGYYGGRQMNSFEIVSALRSKYGDSFYVFDLEKLRENYSGNVFIF